MKKLTRDKKNGVIGGVCAGLADYFNTDVVLFRLLFVLGLLSTFPFVLIYILLWIFVPKNNDIL
jgi:phage shock protein PspC (stress-responsive transcriptional regulator)